MRIAIVVGVGFMLAACGGHSVDLGVNDSGAGGDGAGGGSPFFLQAVLATPQASEAPCTFTSSPKQPTFSTGILDVEAESAFANAYYAEFLVGNRLDTGSEVEETSRVIIAGAYVTVTDSTGNELANYTTLGAGQVDPAPPGGVAYGPVNFEIVDPATVTSLREKLPPFGKTTITTRTQVYGETLGGESVTSNVFEFGITACRGCLIAFDTAPDVEPQPNCLGHGPAGEDGQGACFYGQDVPFDCHACSDIDPFCLCAKSSCPK